MANPEHVERLKRSVEEWNEWRREYPEVQPNLPLAELSGADLRGAILTNANLNGADLGSADLDSADLSEADLKGADLVSARLGGADLRGADLTNAQLSLADLGSAKLDGVDLRSAILSGADLTDAHLSHANLKGAYLDDVIFRQTRFYQTFFAWIDLNSAKELETALHDGPSILDINSVKLPHDKHTRLHFLRGVGFTETQIEYLPSLLTSQPIQYSSLFISYAHQDETVAKRLYTDLRKKDVPCWFAPHDLRPGTLIVRGIDEAIHQQDKLLLILSHHAVNSPWVQYEVESALHKQVVSGRETLFPIRLDNAILESTTEWSRRLCKHHIGDFTSWPDEAAYQQAFSTLLKHLKVDKTPTV